MAPGQTPTREELHAIERLANQVVLEGRKVSRSWHKREEAEAKYGLTLLQGGIPKGRDVRVVGTALDTDATPDASRITPPVYSPAIGSMPLPSIRVWMSARRKMVFTACSMYSGWPSSTISTARLPAQKPVISSGTSG